MFESNKWMLDYNFLYIPRWTCECDDQMNLMNMYIPEKTTFIPMNIIPFDDDLLSLEVNDSFYNSLSLEDLEFSSQAYDAIMRLEKVYGTIKYKFAKGNVSCAILNKILKQHALEGLIQDAEPGLRSDMPKYTGYKDIK